MLNAKITIHNVSSAHTLEKDKHEVGEKRTHDTALPTGLSLDSVTLTVSGLCKKTTKFVFEFVN